MTSIERSVKRHWETLRLRKNIVCLENSTTVRVAKARVKLMSGCVVYVFNLINNKHFQIKSRSD
jgi:hypothetical protein